jgi:hypothetical protein
MSWQVALSMTMIITHSQWMIMMVATKQYPVYANEETDMKSYEAIDQEYQEENDESF